MQVDVSALAQPIYLKSLVYLFWLILLRRTDPEWPLLCLLFPAPVKQRYSHACDVRSPYLFANEADLLANPHAQVLQT